MLSNITEGEGFHGASEVCTCRLALYEPTTWCAAATVPCTCEHTLWMPLPPTACHMSGFISRLSTALFLDILSIYASCRRVRVWRVVNMRRAPRCSSC